MDFDDHAPMWAEAASRTLKFCATRIEIDHIRGTVNAPSVHDDSYGLQDCKSFDELHEYLMGVYDEQWYLNVPFDHDSAVFDSESWWAAYEAIEAIPELNEFFAKLVTPPNTEELALASELLNEGITGDDVVLSLADIDSELIAYLAKYPSKMRELTSRKFEELIAEMFKNQGYDVELTPASKDGGRDVIAVRNDYLGTVLVYTECKRYADGNKVGVEVARGLYGVVESEKATRGVIATTSTFTKGVFDFQQKVPNRLSLADFDVLKSQIKNWKN